MGKYDKLKQDLLEKGEGKMKVFGNSMLPKIKSGALLTYSTKEKYEIGDIVFCKCKGRIIDFLNYSIFKVKVLNDCLQNYKLNKWKILYRTGQ